MSQANEVASTESHYELRVRRTPRGYGEYVPHPEYEMEEDVKPTRRPPMHSNIPISHRSDAFEEAVMDEPHEMDPSYHYNMDTTIERGPTFPAERFGAPKGTELSEELKDNLRKLKNVLKLPKARRFVYCEFFYSGVDKQIFLGENEFAQLLKETFPNLKTVKLRKPEWRAIRRLIGKPRRCSEVFLEEERQALEAKRTKIRTVYNGSCVTVETENGDIPSLLPRPLVVGMKVYARVRNPKDGIYTGTIDAVLDDGYRVVFEKEEMIPPMICSDSEVMAAQPQELLPLNHFLEMNRANIRNTLKMAPAQLFPSPRMLAEQARTQKNVVGVVVATNQSAGVPTYSFAPKKVTPARDEKVGNFPVRMLVILVKLCKLVELKKQFIVNLTIMNDAAEKMNLYENKYPDLFKTRFAELIIDIEHLNKLIKAYVDALLEYNTTLLPQLNQPAITDRPELLRRTCQTHAFQIVKHCNSDLHVQSKSALSLITNLTAILLQIRTIGQQSKRCTAYDLRVLSESLQNIRSQISPSNAAAFQDFIEVHIKQIHQMMLQHGLF